MNFDPSDLDYMDQLQNKEFKVPVTNVQDSTAPTPQQSAFRDVANSTITPFQNAQNNISKTWNDITNPQKGFFDSAAKDAGDLYNLKNNPFGGGQSPRPQTTKLSDEHLGPKNENGVRPVLPSGYDQLKNFGIQDNSALLSSQPQAALGINATPQDTKGQPSALGSAAKGAGESTIADAAGSDSGILGALLDLL